MKKWTSNRVLFFRN